MQDTSKLDQPEILSRLFYPRNEATTPLPKGAVDVNFEVESGISIGCRFYLHDPLSPSILYFHGNGEIPCDLDDRGLEYMSVGCNLLVTSYRGYGGSSGSPTVASMFGDARRLFEAVGSWLHQKGYTAPLFLMGRSLGSVCAIDLASVHGDTVKGLIIESGFADTLPLLQALSVPRTALPLNEEEGFGNKEKIGRVRMPTLILHGARDQLIPHSEGEKLQAASGARNKQFLLIPGADHNTVVSTAGRLYYQTIRQFIDNITGTSSWRNRRKASKADRKDAL
ncbi:MAG: alpha/beta hydrolase [Desulfocapsaceae bacterium]|nr:alpha/beta hydrolase [Desulfocapsaceae bacterium]